VRWRLYLRANAIQSIDLSSGNGHCICSVPGSLPNLAVTNYSTRLTCHTHYRTPSASLLRLTPPLAGWVAVPRLHAPREIGATLHELSRLITLFPSVILFLPLSKKYQLKIFLIFFIFFITLTIFYYYLNKIIHHNTIFFFIFSYKLSHFISHQSLFTFTQQKYFLIRGGEEREEKLLNRASFAYHFTCRF